MQPPRFAWSPPPNLETTTATDVLRDLDRAHHLDGVVHPGDPPIVFLTIPQGVDVADVSPPVPWGWEGPFGAAVSLSSFARGHGWRRAHIPRSHAAFGDLERGHVLVVLVKQRRFVASLLVDLNAAWPNSNPGASYREALALVANACPVIDDPTTAYWDLLAQNEAFKDQLTPQDRLSIGWAARQALHVRFLEHALAKLRECLRRPSEPAGLDDLSRVLWDVLFKESTTTPKLVEAVESLIGTTDGAFFDLVLAVQRSSEEALRQTRDEMVSELPICALDTCIAGARRTRCGSLLPWLDKLTGGLRFLQLEPTRFRPGFDPAEYWRRLRSVSPFHAGALISGHDVPFDAKRKPMLPFPVADDISKANDVTKSLLDEAVRDKRWTIPPGAVVELPIGPFSHVECWEVDSEYFFVCRTPEGDFAMATCEPDKHYIGFGGVILDRQKAEDERIWAAVRLLFSSLVRDFVVVDEREAVFSHRSQRKPWSTGKASDEPVVVYLPRVRYRTKLDVGTCASELGHRERRGHHVAPHLRRAEQPSDDQLILARRYGFTIPKGYTFVRPHERGKSQRDVIYRSRSALRSLYSATETPSAPARAQWFQFERDVHKVMAGMGFVVQHVAASKRGDRGVDIYATKGKDLDEVNWVVQCKCYAPERKIGPHVIRELIGTLSEYRRGTRGMVVTTSTFSADARRLAATAEIRLLEGDEFARLQRSNST